VANGIYCGEFDKETTGVANALQSVTGLPFQPKAILFFCTVQTAEGFKTDQQICIGAAVGTGSAQQVCCYGGQPGNSTVAGSYGYATSTNCIRLTTPPGVTLIVGNLNSFDSGGFTIIWVTNTTTAYKINFMAFGGSDITNVFVEAPGTTATGNRTYSNAGFQGNIAFFFGGMSAGTVGAMSQPSFGVAMSSSKRWATVSNSISTTMSSSSHAKKYQRTDCCMLGLSNSGTETLRIDFVGFTSTGFTVNCITSLSTIFLYLLIQGGSWDLGSFNKSTAAAPVDQSVSGLAFAPDGVLLASDNAASSTSVQANCDCSLGAFDGTNQQTEWAGSIDAVSPSQSESAQLTTKCLRLAAPTSTTAAATKSECQQKSLDSTGFTVTWTTNDTTVASEILWVAGKLTAGTPVSQTAVLNYEALGLISRVEISNIEAAGKSSSSAISNFEALTGAKQSGISVFEALTRAARSGVSNEEALGRIIQTAIKNIEARGTVTTSAIHSLEALTRAVQSAVDNWEATKGLTSSRLENWEALTRQATAAISNFEAQGLTVVSNVEISNLEALTGLTRSAVEAFEVLGRIARAAVENWEAQSSLAAARIALFESGISIKNPAISNLEALGLVKLTAASYFEALTAIARAAGQVFEALGRVARPAISAFEAQGNILITSAEISNLEALGILARPAASYFEAVGALSRAAGLVFEALTRQATARISPFESQGFTLVSTAELSNVEALGRVARPAAGYFEAIGALSRAAGLVFEVLARAAAPAISNFAAAGLVSRTELSSIESSSSAAIRSAIQTFEALVGGAGELRIATATFEALKRAAGQAIASVEATGQYLPLSQIASSSFEALHSVARGSGQMNIEWVRLAYGLILAQVLFAQLLTTEQGFAATVELDKEFASTLELVARFLIHE